MKYKIKTFETDSMFDLEIEIYKWLQDKTIEVIDISHSSHFSSYTPYYNAIIIYR